MVRTAAVAAARKEIIILDVFSTMGFVWAEAVATTVGVLGGRLVAILHGGGMVGRAHSTPRRLSRLFSSCAAVVTPSRFLKRELEALGFGPIQVIPNGLDLRRYEFRWREVLSPSMVWLRGFREGYRPDVAVKTVERVREFVPDVHLTMAGPRGSDRTFRSVLSMIRSKGLESSISLLGPVPKPKVPEFLQDKDIFLNTTEYESFGVAAMEAAACGLCLVTSAVGEHLYHWVDGKNALLVPPGDPETMAKAVLRLLSEQSLAARVSFGGRLVSEKYRWEAVLPMWQELLEGLARHHA
jgi:glycosyltransferase involved in cell wall biosynthesis